MLFAIFVPEAAAGQPHSAEAGHAKSRQRAEMMFLRVLQPVRGPATSCVVRIDAVMELSPGLVAVALWKQLQLLETMWKRGCGCESMGSLVQGEEGA